MWNPFRREPIIESVITIQPGDGSLAGVMQRHNAFVNLCLAHNVSLEPGPEPSKLKVMGRESDMTRFMTAFHALSKLGLV